ncbi:MAG: serine/threonine protein kinase [Deltaproteobacteria bacterium]|nr:serine/threonine protein kinase [Deltaproteobacteria bacterium]
MVAVSLGRYEVLRLLATGGMAELYLARTRGAGGFEKPLVLKRMLPQIAEDPDLRTMFLDEARLAATLHHPNVVQVFDLGEDAGQYFFAMEYVHGSDVHRLMRAASGVLPLDVSIEIVSQTAAGLHHAHERVDDTGTALGIVHRDVSPSNMLCTWEGCVKLADFGIAKAASHRSRTRTGTIRGKTAYMSPEQCKGDPVDRRSDVFALAIVLYELTTGRRVFDGDNDYAVLHKITSSDVPPPSSIVPAYPAELERIVMRGLRRERDERYPSAAALRDDLEAFARGHGLATGPSVIARVLEERLGPPTPWPVALPARPPRPPTAATVVDAIAVPRTMPRARRRLGWAIGAGAAAIAVAAIVIVGATSGSSPAAPAVNHTSSEGSPPPPSARPSAPAPEPVIATEPNKPARAPAKRADKPRSSKKPSPPAPPPVAPPRRAVDLDSPLP